VPTKVPTTHDRTHLNADFVPRAGVRWGTKTGLAKSPTESNQTSFFGLSQAYKCVFNQNKPKVFFKSLKGYFCKKYQQKYQQKQLTEKGYCEKRVKNMTHTFNLSKRYIRLIVSHDGEKFRKSTGLSIEPTLWKKSAKSLSAQCKDAEVYKKLRLIHLRLLEKEESVSTRDDVMDAIEYGLTGKVIDRSKLSRPTFWKYFREWGERPSPVQRQRRLYPNIVSKLMGEEEDWEQIDSAYYFRLCREMDNYGCSINYKGAIIAKLKLVMNEGFKQKFHKNEEFRFFRRMSEVPETIALTRDELDALWECKDFTQMESKARDLFIIGTYAVARWEDYSRMTVENVSNGMLNYVQLKTGKTVILPASPRLIACLERNGGRAPELSQQKFNEAIKRCCRKIGMTAKVYLSVSKGARREARSIDRCDLCSSHTARRTGCTLLYLSGVPIKRCMMLSGHKTEKVFMNYIRITKEENAIFMSQNAFFR